MGMFQKATKKKIALKIALTGSSGAGKTYSALRLATGIGGRIAFLDTENRSSELYSDKFNFDIALLEPPYNPERFIEVIHEAENQGYETLIIDSLSSEWAGTGGILELVDKSAKASKSGNSYYAWKEITPRHQKLIDTILQSRINIIACMRSKQSYITQERNGKQVPVKVGLAPIQRENVEFEFTIIFDISVDGHIATASKDRTAMFDNWADVITEEIGEKLIQWRDNGKDFYSDKYVVIEDGHTQVLTKSGHKDIEQLTIEELERLLNVPSYKAAHSAIAKLLEELKPAEPEKEGKE